MKAIVVTRFGGPEVLSWVEVDDPVPAPDEVLIRVHTTNVNFADIQSRLGNYRRDGEPPFVPGLEACGVIVALGTGVAKGTELASGAGLAGGVATAQSHLKPGQRVVAFASRGSYGELMTATAALTYPLPDGLGFDDVAGLTALVTAENVLVRSGGLRVDETVLVHAAAGGVGLLAVQLARHYGAGAVIGTVGSPDKARMATAAGATAVIEYHTEDFAERVLELTAGRGADLILDSVGGATFSRNFACLAPFGRVVCFGQSSGEPGLVATDKLYKNNWSVLGYSSGHIRAKRPEEMGPVAERVLNHLLAGVVHIPVGARFPLSRAAEAQVLVESRRSFGKVVLEVAGSDARH